MTECQPRGVKVGDQIRVNYVGRFEDGAVFDSSEGHEPFEFTVGAEQVIPGFDSAVIGMKPGESCKVVISPEEGYGVHVPEMVAEIERQQIPNHEQLVIGNMLEVGLENGQTIEVQIVELSEKTVVLDGNHPLAGKPLHFEIEMLEFV